MKKLSTKLGKTFYLIILVLFHNITSMTITHTTTTHPTPPTPTATATATNYLPTVPPPPPSPTVNVTTITTYRHRHQHPPIATTTYVTSGIWKVNYRKKTSFLKANSSSLGKESRRVGSVVENQLDELERINSTSRTSFGKP